MQGIFYKRYVPNEENVGLTAQLVECFRDVFADRPWHEWLQCPVCKQYWGKEESRLLASLKFRHCDQPLVDYWPRDRVISDVHQEITSESSCWLSIDRGKVIGFCWGYSIALADLEKKLKVIFDGDLQSKYATVAYQDEIGVLASHRGHKIAKAMVRRRLDDFVSQGLLYGVVRTRQSPEPSETFLWYTQKLGYEVIARYPEGDGRVVLGRELNGLACLFE